MRPPENFDCCGNRCCSRAFNVYCNTFRCWLRTSCRPELIWPLSPAPRFSSLPLSPVSAQQRIPRLLPSNFLLFEYLGASMIHVHASLPGCIIQPRALCFHLGPVVAAARMLGNVLGSKNAIISHSVIIPHLFILAFCVACLDAVALSVMVTCLFANLGVFAVSPKVSSVCFCGVPYIFFHSNSIQIGVLTAR